MLQAGCDGKETSASLLLYYRKGFHMKKRIIMLIAAVAVILALGQSAAAGLATFVPQNSSKVKPLYNGSYQDAGGRKQSKRSGSCVIPALAEYRHGIKPIKKGSGHTIVKRGTRLASSAVNRINKAVPSAKAATDRLIWFDTKKGMPKLAYTGFRIWDEDLGTYVRLYIEVAVIGVSTSHNQPDCWQEAGKPRAIAFTRTTNSYSFDGLPDVVVFGNGSADVRVSYYKATGADGDPASWGKGDAYKVVSNVTYRDIDAYQAISIKKSSAHGFTGLSSPVPQLKFGPYDGYYSVTSRSATEKETNDQKYFMGFNLEGKSIDMRYTTNQIDYPESNVAQNRLKAGKPSGMYSFFGTTTYDKKEPLVLKDPVKSVTDSDEKKVGYNTLKSTKEGYVYEITQEIPKYLDSSSSFSLKSLKFYDSLDSCLALRNSKSDIKIYSGSKDITNCFTNNSRIENGRQLVRMASKDTAAAKKEINCDFKGGIITMKVPVRVKSSEEILMRHRADSLRAGNNLAGSLHSASGSNYIMIPNEASVRINDSAAKQYTNTVRTRMPVTGNHDIIIKKTAAAAGGERIDKTERFTFVITLNNGSSYDCLISRNDGRTERATLKKNGTFDLAHGETLTIPKVPRSVKYTITERGSQYYSPSFTLDSGAGSLTTKTPGGSAGTGEGLSVTDIINTSASFEPIKYTFTNTRSYRHHDLDITKKVESGDTEKKFPFTLTLSDLAPDKTYVTSDGNKTADSKGQLLVEFELAHNESYFIKALPDDAKYKIGESGTKGYKARFEVTENADKVMAKNGSGDFGKGVSTPEETLKPAGADYDVSYDVYNDNRNLNDFVIGKTVVGTGADEEDGFTFEVRFSNIPKTGQHYKTISAEIYEWKGGKKIIETFPAEDTGSDSYAVQFELKSGWFAAFTDIPDKVSYQITEKGNDYIASYKGSGKNEMTNESLAEVSDANENAYADLGLSRDIPEGMSSKMEYSFVNKKEDVPIYNDLKISKTVTDGADGEFDFTASFTGLEKGRDYALWSEKGDTEYVLSAEEGRILVRSGQGTAGDPYVYKPGVPVEITRADGEKKTIFSDRITNDPGSLEKIQGWIDHKGGSYTARWIGGDGDGAFKGTITSFTSDRDGNAGADLSLSGDTSIETGGLPKGAAYQITERSSKYAPSYTIKRNNVKTGAGEGTEGAELTTKEQVFSQPEETKDHVHFINDRRSYMMKVTKKEEPAAGGDFSFLTLIDDLAGERYMVMRPGDETFEITMSEGGDITLSASNHSGAAGGIPVKMIRPADGAEKIFYTNADGKIPAGVFYDWLAKDQTGAFGFDMEWNGGKVKGHFGP